MKRSLLLITSLFFLINSAYAQKELVTQGLQIEFDKAGKIVSLLGNQEYMSSGMTSELVQIKIDGILYQANTVIWKGAVATMSFDRDIELSVKCTSKKQHIRFEIIKVKNETPIDAVVWGPYANVIDETIGEIVGVVRNGSYALGLQSLNAKTTGGKLNNVDGSDPARGTTATKEPHGSNLQAYCINRNKKRIYNIWNGSIPNAVIPANSDGKLEGSAIALFACKESKVLDVLESIELSEGLPHATLDGEWIKRSREANKPYLITKFTENNIDEVLAYCEKMGYNTIYHEHPFKNWGHFELIKGQFPNGRAGMKMCVEKARAKGIRVGVHTLTNFITTNDPYVTPVPHKGLMTFCETTITKELGLEDKEIFIADTTAYKVKNTCQAVRIGDEIIQFSAMSKDAPYSLENCRRGAYGTKVSIHKSGSTIARLADHAYKTLFPNFEMQKDMIARLADFFNETGVAQFDFDGHEGGWGTGEGEFGMDYFSDEFMAQVNHEVRNGSSRSNHYYWHVNSYINWGEPWYGGFTKSQGHYRYQNQALLKRNYIPNMLGWFLLNKSTTLQEFEYMLARSAGYDAGYALTGSLISFVNNKEFDAIAKAIRTWEEARMARVFSEKQIEALKDVQNDFSLTKNEDATYSLQYYDKEKFELLNELVQPGQPNDVRVEFDCKQEQELYLVVGAVGESGSINQVHVEMNGLELFTIETELKPNYAITYRGDNRILIYDQKGRLKKAEEIDLEGVKLPEGANMLRFSADFSEDAELKLEGYIRLKDNIQMVKGN